ncbi:MAG: PstS family phosphate ABC transporter substrate-binding protein [Coriobacteriia bacterium]|nr:PstS family phosphate ABC transporter substrate-binding protein [Coriobacteriia bacterium]
MKAKKFLAFALVAVLALGMLGLAGCGAEDEPAETPAEGDAGDELSGSITVEGSDTMVNLGQALTEAFMDENMGVDVSVAGGGSGVGVASLINGTVDFANSSRPMKDEETDEAEANGVNPVEFIVAYDGIAIIVNPSLEVDDITFEQVGAIYRGEITNWSEVGGPDLDIVLLSRDTSSGTYAFFLEHVVQQDDKEAVYAASARLLPSTQAIVDETIANEAAIGYVGLGYVVPEIKELAVDGVEASVDSVKDGSYSVARPLFMYSNGEPVDVAKAYIDWILGADGQAVVAELGFVPVD